MKQTQLLLQVGHTVYHVYLTVTGKAVFVDSIVSSLFSTVQVYPI